MAKVKRYLNFESLKMQRIKSISILLLLTGLLPVATAQGRIKFEGLTIKNETAFYKGKPFTGVSVATYEDNTLAEEVNWKEGKMDGMKTEYYQGAGIHARIGFRDNRRNGGFTYFYRNGRPKLKGSYRDNLLHDTLWSWYPSGGLQYLHVYDKGIKTGRMITWFSNGAVEQECMLIGGKPHGEMRNYYMDSSLRSIIHYNRGVREGSALTWHNTGCLAEEAYYKNGMLDSVHRVWDNLRCELIRSGSYKKGKKEGTFLTLDFLGDTISLETFREGKLHGPYITWHEKQRDTEGGYFNGKKHGYWKHNQANKYQWREGEYDEDTQIGTWWYYDTKGRKLMLQRFDDNGNLLEEKVFKKI